MGGVQLGMDGNLGGMLAQLMGGTAPSLGTPHGEGAAAGGAGPAAGGAPGQATANQRAGTLNFEALTPLLDADCTIMLEWKNIRGQVARCELLGERDDGDCRRMRVRGAAPWGLDAF